MVRASALICLLLAGCDQGMSEIAKVQQDIRVMKSKADFESDRTTRLLLAMPPKGTTLRWGTGKGFQMITTEYGPISVELKNLAADGSATVATMQFGNPSLATLKDCSAQLQWGKLNESDMPVYTDPARKSQFSSDIKPGTWSSGTFTLPKTDPKTVQFLDVDAFDCSTISLKAG